MIVKLLGNFYSDDDITSAKNILLQTAINDRDAPRLIKRKGKDKSLNNIQYILKIFLQMPPQSVPCYETKELSRLPPLNELFRCVITGERHGVSQTPPVNFSRVPRNVDERRHRSISAKCAVHLNPFPLSTILHVLLALFLLTWMINMTSM